MDNKTLAQAVRKVLKGYLFIFVSINLLGFDLLPDFIGYIMILSALPVISEKEKSAKLLKPIGTVLGIWSLLEWILKIGYAQINIKIVLILISVLGIYVDYQLITNISELASDSKIKRRIRILRDTVVITHTVASIFVMFPKLVYAALAVGIVQFIMFIWILIEFRRLAKALENEDAENKESALSPEENENQTDSIINEETNEPKD